MHLQAVIRRPHPSLTISVFESANNTSGRHRMKVTIRNSMNRRNLSGLFALRRGCAGILPAFTRSRSSFPALKKGTDFSSTETEAPVLGLRPVRASRCLTVKAPKPRNSTRSPRASAKVISSKIVATMVSTSCPRKCGLAAASSAISSDFVKIPPGDQLPERCQTAQRAVKTKAL